MLASWPSADSATFTSLAANVGIPTRLEEDNGPQDSHANANERDFGTGGQTSFFDVDDIGKGDFGVCTGLGFR